MLLTLLPPCHFFEPVIYMWGLGLRPQNASLTVLALPLEPEALLFGFESCGLGHIGQVFVLAMVDAKLLLTSV